MSFSSDVKKEIMGEMDLSSCCTRSMLYGMLLCGRSFDERAMYFTTDKKDIVQLAMGLFQNAFPEQHAKIIELTRAAGKEQYQFAVASPDSRTTLLRTFGHNERDITLRAKQQSFTCDECVRHFLAGVFLVVGRMTNPQKEYHLELGTIRKNLTQDIADLCSRQGWHSGIAQRQHSYYVYFKGSHDIEELLVALGAPLSAVEMMNIKIYKGIRNKVNRITNCETANIEKTVQAATSQIADIAYILDSKGEAYLSDELIEAAKLRMNNPELSLSALAAQASNTISRSSLNRRLKKLQEIARELRGDNSNG